MKGPTLEDQSSGPANTSSPPYAGSSRTLRWFTLRCLHSEPFWWGVCLVSAIVLVFADRQFLNPDGLSYVEIASSAVRNGPGEFLNGYWSPFYPALLSLALLFHPSLHHEVLLFHLVNFLIFVATLCTFHFFLRGWIAHLEQFGPVSQQQKRAIIPFGYCLFLWFILKSIGVGNLTPDLAVAAVLFLIAGLICRLAIPGTGLKHYVVLGLVLALGYYAKAVMFPLELMLLAWLFLFPPCESGGAFRRKLLVSLSFFLLAAGPLIAALSNRVGHLTYGETGRLNYAWFVNGAPKYSGWTGGAPVREGIPQHAPRKLIEQPLVLEFDAPVPGSFPLWYDPSYWYAGYKVHFDLHQQISALRITLAKYEVIFAQTAVFFAGAVVLGFLGARRNSLLHTASRVSWLLVWPLGAVLLYALVHVEARFLGAYFILGWMTVYGMPGLHLNQRVAGAICATVSGTTAILFLGYLGVESARAANDLAHGRQPDYQLVAASLRDLGARDGDRLAMVGHESFPLYARYAGTRVVAEIVSPGEFWNLSPDELRAVTERLEQMGVKAIVANRKPVGLGATGWHDVNTSGQVRYSVLVLGGDSGHK